MAPIQSKLQDPNNRERIIHQTAPGTASFFDIIKPDCIYDFHLQKDNHAHFIQKKNDVWVEKTHGKFA